jgi:predicted small metal-binding protein
MLAAADREDEVMARLALWLKVAHQLRTAL